MNRVLILEDDPLIASAMATMVEDSLGCTVHLAAGVAQAMPLVEDGLKLALLDVQVADGKSFPLASLVVTRNIPCLFLSGSEPRSVPSDLASIPFLRKPVPPGQLIAAVQHYLR